MKPAGREANWRRVFCWWWGHEYVMVQDVLTGHDGVACMRCFVAEFSEREPR